MKKLLFVGVLLVLLVPAVAAACPPNKVEICHATSGSHPFNLIEVAKEASVGGHDGHSDDIIPVFTYTTTVEQCGWEWVGWRLKWRCHDVEVTHTYGGKNLTTIYGGEYTGAEVLANGCVVPPPSYETCDETDTVYGDWSEWEYNPESGLLERSRTITLVDARDKETVCDTGLDTQTDEYPACEFTKKSIEGGDVVYRDINTGQVCFSECYEVWNETDFALYTLEGPDGQQATMYAYRLPDGTFPKGIAVFRQECVLGWVAVNMSKTGVVEKNSCTGAYRWRGLEFFPRQDVIETGQCDRSGACLK